jgi:hypothetical protein
MRRAAIATVGLVLLAASSAGAHKPSDSYLTLEVDGRRVNGRWDIALRDLEQRARPRPGRNGWGIAPTARTP